MLFLGQTNQRFRKVDAYSRGWLGLSEQVSGAAADFQDTGPNWNEEIMQLCEVAVIVAIALGPAIHLRGQLIKGRSHLGLEAIVCLGRIRLDRWQHSV